ncbi:hypothetical protein Taro_038901 [Colocasia esculenta]|uniref:GrpE protein homolog n=1 Tax=Colocasia esculenta TaxID=4460 RepID=A0A843W7X8_COLES|nr:hypothetical protein [Colocasia esculenta]
MISAIRVSVVSWVPKLPCHMIQLQELSNFSLQRFGFSSSSYPQPNEEANEFSDEKGSVGLHDTVSVNDSQAEASSESVKGRDGDNTPEQTQDLDSTHSKPHSMRRRRRGTKRTAFSDSDTEPDLSIEDLVKLVAEKEELLKLKHKEIEKMQEKVLLSYADMENVIDRTKREAENSKKFAIQTFAKSLLDVADNLARASSVVTESFSKIDSSKDSVGAVQLLKTLLEGVEMTEKQLMEPGYMIYDRVLRPAEVGVTETVNDEVKQNSGE